MNLTTFMIIFNNMFYYFLKNANMNLLGKLSKITIGSCIF